MTYKSDLAQAFDRSPPRDRILNVPISLVTMADAIDTIRQWIEQGVSRFVCLRDVHGVMLSHANEELLRIHEDAGMVTPDGMPLVWILRKRGHAVSRVCGADLVLNVCELSLKIGASHFFYGGKPGVAERMSRELTARFPGLKVAGHATPPFRPLTDEEDRAFVEMIRESGAKIVWVGLSTPKQEYWMKKHVRELDGAVLFGVGAAFDFFSGDVRRAPMWMQDFGLEWLHRLCSEPKRLWRRYLILAPLFVLRSGLQELRRRGTTA